MDIFFIFFLLKKIIEPKNNETIKINKKLLIFRYRLK